MTPAEERNEVSKEKGEGKERGGKNTTGSETHQVLILSTFSPPGPHRQKNKFNLNCINSSHIEPMGLLEPSV